METSSPILTVRTDLRPGDLGEIVRLHGTIYAQEHGFDRTFEAYVAGPLAEFARRSSARERIWIAERMNRIAGCVAIVAADDDVAQLRWFLVSPAARGSGLGTLLLREAVTFSRERGYASVILWTVAVLNAAGRLYRAAGFRRIAEAPAHQWGVDVVEEQYELLLR